MWVQTFTESSHVRHLQQGYGIYRKCIGKYVRKNLHEFQVFDTRINFGSFFHVFF